MPGRRRRGGRQVATETVAIEDQGERAGVQIMPAEREGQSVSIHAISVSVIMFWLQHKFKLEQGICSLGLYVIAIAKHIEVFSTFHRA